MAPTAAAVKSIRWRSAATAAVAIAGLSASPRLSPPPAAASDAAPVPVLDWRFCTGPGQQGFDCATAQVPLDHRAPQGAAINLALIRHRATDPDRRLGAIFWNPGGPGASGTAFLPKVLAAPTTPAPLLFSSALRERFDIISWDPRGIGASTAVKCFDTPDEEDRFIEALPAGVPATAAERSAYIRGYAQLAELCAARNGALLEHVSTTETARDLDLLRQAVGDPRLNYVGDSYGTYLGAIYANLFPDRVRALALIGNIDAVAANPGRDHPRLSNFLRQRSDRGTAKTLDAFLALCGRASEADCAFSAGSAAATREKWETLLERVRADPVTIGDQVYDYDLLVTALVTSLYQVPGWTAAASTLEQVWRGGREADAAPTAATAAPATAAPAVEELTSWALAVRCPETTSPRDPEAYFALADLAYDRAGDVGPYWTWRDAQCAAWPAVAADRYTGPWDVPTANPVLLINTTHDPATPLRNAAVMARTLARARLLTVAGYGHVLGGVPSTCVNEYMTGYFVDGTLPPEGTVCRQDVAPFTAAPGP